MEFSDDGFGSFGSLVYENIDTNEADVLIIGIPYESATSGKKGASFAPMEIRKVSADMQTMSRDGIDLNDMVLKDMGNIPVFTVEGEKTRKNIEDMYDQLSDVLKNPNTTVLTLGGDHSNTYPILKALQKLGTVGVIWFDAHRDVLEELMGSRWSHGSPLRNALELDNILYENVLLVGTRYMEPSEQEFVTRFEISEYKMADIEDSEFSYSLFQNKVREISSRVDFLYVSIDIDVLDPAFAPGTGTPVGGGMSTSQLMKFIRSISPRVTAYDIMEVAPPHDHAEITVKATMGLISEILTQIKLAKLSG